MGSEGHFHFWGRGVDPFFGVTSYLPLVVFLPGVTYYLTV